MAEGNRRAMADECMSVDRASASGFVIKRPEPEPSRDAGFLRLTYASIAATGFDGHREYAVIVDHARLANRQAGIGGVLAFDGHQFLQILEGPVEPVEALFERITGDPRHYGVVCLRHTPVAVRYFSEWGMRRQPAIDILQLSEKIR